MFLFIDSCDAWIANKIKWVNESLKSFLDDTFTSQRELLKGINYKINLSRWISLITMILKLKTAKSDICDDPTNSARFQDFLDLMNERSRFDIRALVNTARTPSPIATIGLGPGDFEHPDPNDLGNSSRTS
jgi:hypothetical protein